MTTPNEHTIPHDQHTTRRGPVHERTRDAFTELRELTEHRAESLARAEREAATAIEDAKRRYDKSTEQARADLEDTLRVATEEEQANHATTSQIYDATIRSLYEERKGLLSEREEKTQAKREAAEAENNDARWLVTSVHDSDVAQAPALAKSRLEALDELLRTSRECQQAHADLLTELGAQPATHTAPETESLATVEETIALVKESLTRAHNALDALERSPFPKASRGAGYAVFAVVVIIAGAAGGFFAGGIAFGPPFYAGLALGVVLAVLSRFALGALAKKTISRLDAEAAQALMLAQSLESEGRERTQSELRERLDKIDLQTEREKKEVEEKHTRNVDRIEKSHAERVHEIHQAYSPKIERLESERDGKREAASARRMSIEDQARARFDSLTEDARRERDNTIREATDSAARTREALDQRWREASPRLANECATLKTAGLRHAPPWESTHSNEDATPPALVRLGWARWSVPEEAAGEPVEWIGDRSIELPLGLEFPTTGSMVVEADRTVRTRASDLVRGAMLRLLTTIPPGKVRFTIIDPVGLGESFAAFMHLADHQEQLVSGRIWTEPRHVEQRLLDLTEHMEMVIQKYLRNDYPTIESYNRAAGEIAEPYRFLVIADFPTNISETAAKRIASILNSGARCGVHTILLRDPSTELPKSLTAEDLRSHALTIRPVEDDRVEIVGDDAFDGLGIRFDTPPDDARTKSLLRAVGERSIDAGRVQVPFTAVGPGEGEAWTLSAADALRIPVGRSGASKVQQLVLGEGTAQHALIAGRTGSGKSTLFHVIITSCAAWYSTDEVELYLVDFKKGVEFKPYATHTLPHARVIAIETARAFGLSVLQRIDQELTERGERMRTAEVQNLASFRERTGERMPRVLVVVDEFQELFVEDDQIAQESAMLLDRIVRQGRAFGVHVVLGSQTLGGAYAINRATMSQMNVRIALQCDEQDSYLILGEDNAAARLLERPGEAVYNAQSGKVEANSPFQIVWLPDAVRDEQLGRLSVRSQQSNLHREEPFVFEGNAPADPGRTPQLSQSRNTPLLPDEPIRAHLGIPVAIAEPVAASLERGRGENLLMLSSNTNAARGTTGVILLGLDRMLHATPGSTVHLVHQEAAITNDLGSLASSLGTDVRTHSVNGVRDALLEIDAEVERRLLIESAQEPPLVFMLAGLHRCRDIAKSDEMGFSFGEEETRERTPGDMLDRIIRDGPSLGVHTILWCDTLSAFERALDRRRMGEFSHRVLTQMNAMDSSAVLDSPAASRLSQGRALYYNDRTTVSVTLRPYAFPDAASFG